MMLWALEAGEVGQLGYSQLLNDNRTEVLRESQSNSLCDGGVGTASSSEAEQVPAGDARPRLETGRSGDHDVVKNSASAERRTEEKQEENHGVGGDEEPDLAAAVSSTSDDDWVKVGPPPLTGLTKKSKNKRKKAQENERNEQDRVAKAMAVAASSNINTVEDRAEDAASRYQRTPGLLPGVPDPALFADRLTKQILTWKHRKTSPGPGLWFYAGAAIAFASAVGVVYGFVLFCPPVIPSNQRTRLCCDVPWIFVKNSESVVEMDMEIGELENRSTHR